MWPVSLLLCILTLITGMLARSNAKWNPVAAGLTVLMLLSLGLQTLRHGKAKHAEYDTVWDESIGYTLAKVLTEDGITEGTVFLIDEAIPEAENPLDLIHYQGFQSGLPADSGLNLVKIQAWDLMVSRVSPAEELPPEMMPKEQMDLSLSRIMETIGAHQNVVAVVSFVGLPASMSKAQLAGLPPLYLSGLREFTTDLPDEFLLRIPSIRAIVRRNPESENSAKPTHKNMDGIFAERFILKQRSR
ncbi:hypothetical protein P0Y35_12300 [Kiritimatiellaeota bacterium B1221]|nr:hypothetical protein [Kiritimatiellaeota bacterium B1221]